MITEGKPISIKQIIKEINEELGRLRKMIVEASKTPEHLTEDMLMFTPDEWEIIGILIMHYDFFQKKMKECKNEAELYDLLKEQGNFLGVVRDVSMKLTSRLERQVNEA